MMQPRNIPGFHEAIDWPFSPARPLRVTDFWRMRSGGARVVLADVGGTEYRFGFDQFLGRLFCGTGESADDAAWVRVGSPLEAEVLTLLREAASDTQWPDLADTVEQALHWSSIERPPAAG